MHPFLSTKILTRIIYLHSHPHLLYIVRVLKQQQRHDHNESPINQHYTSTQNTIMKTRKKAYRFNVSLMKVLTAVHASYVASVTPWSTSICFFDFLDLLERLLFELRLVLVRRDASYKYRSAASMNYNRKHIETTV